MNGRYVRVRGLALAGLFLAVAVAFLLWHLALPSDGARLEPGEQVWTANGVVVTPLGDGLTSLRAGDVVVAVEGRSLQAWTESLFQPGSAHNSPVSGRPLHYTILRDRHLIDLSISPITYPLGTVLGRSWSTILFTLFTQLVMTIVFLLRPRDRAARALFVCAFSLSHVYAWAIGLQVTDILSGVGFWLFQFSANVFWLITWSSGLELALVFPRPHPVLQKWPWLVRAVYASSFLLFFFYLLLARVLSPTITGWVGSWIVGNWLVAVIFEVMIAYFIFTNYRSTRDPAARKKVRWVLFAFALTGVIQLSLWFIPGILLGQPLIDANALGISLLPVPVMLGIAIVRDQLFDIDLIIHRTLIYSVLTATLAVLYLGSVVVLQQLFRTLSGQGDDFAIILSTLGIAALAVPLRNRIQESIDRRFYRRKYDAGRVLAAFAATARDEVDLQKLEDELLTVVDETMQPVSAGLWLRPGEQEKRGL